MPLHCIDNAVAKHATQKRHSDVLVQIVDAAQRGRFTVFGKQVSQVMQQGSGHEFIVSAGLLGQQRGL